MRQWLYIINHECVSGSRISSLSAAHSNCCWLRPERQQTKTSPQVPKVVAGAGIKQAVQNTTDKIVGGTDTEEASNTANEKTLENVDIIELMILKEHWTTRVERVFLRYFLL